MYAKNNTLSLTLSLSTYLHLVTSGKIFFFNLYSQSKLEMSYYINTEDSIEEQLQLGDSFTRDSTGSYSDIEYLEFDFDEEDQVNRFSSPFQITPQYLRCLT